MFHCIPFSFLSSPSCSSLRHYNHFFKIYLSLSLSAAASITSPPSVPSSVFLPRHPSRLLVLFSFALLSRFYLSFFCLASPQGLTSPPTVSPLSLFSTYPSIISSLCLYFLQAKRRHLPTPLAASCHFYFCLPNFQGQNVKFTQDSLALSLLYSYFFFAPLSGPPPIFGRRRMESSPNWPKLKVLTCASICSTNQIMVSTSAKLTTASGTARGSTHSWCKVKNTGGVGQNEGCVVGKM